MTIDYNQDDAESVLRFFLAAQYPRGRNAKSKLAAYQNGFLDALKMCGVQYRACRHGLLVILAPDGSDFPPKTNP